MIAFTINISVTSTLHFQVLITGPKTFLIYNFDIHFLTCEIKYVDLKLDEVLSNNTLIYQNKTCFGATYRSKDLKNGYFCSKLLKCFSENASMFVDFLGHSDDTIFARIEQTVWHFRICVQLRYFLTLWCIGVKFGRDHCQLVLKKPVQFRLRYKALKTFFVDIILGFDVQWVELKHPKPLITWNGVDLLCTMIFLISFWFCGPFYMPIEVNFKSYALKYRITP